VLNIAFFDVVELFFGGLKGTVGCIIEEIS